MQALTRVPNVASWTQCRAFSLTRPVSLARFIREADSLSQTVQAFKRPFGGVVKPETIVRPRPRVRLPDSRPAVEAKTHIWSYGLCMLVEKSVLVRHAKVPVTTRHDVAFKGAQLPPALPLGWHLVGMVENSYLVDPASSHMLVSKIKPCMSKYTP